MGRNKALILAAVVAVLATATTAQAYYEKWSMPWNNGYIYYNSRYYYYITHQTAGYTVCVSGMSTDAFISDSTWFTICFATNDGRPGDTLFLDDSTYSTHNNFDGTKQTGQSGTKEGSGTWCTYCTNKDFYVWGTWNTYDDPNNNKFDYGYTPPIVTGDWAVVNGTVSVSGGGTFAGTSRSTW
ncbi:hypothetical protein GX441_04475 [bacterium]|nr:hypothetical protein [bacterium]